MTLRSFASDNNSGAHPAIMQAALEWLKGDREGIEVPESWRVVRGGPWRPAPGSDQR